MKRNISSKIAGFTVLFVAVLYFSGGALIAQHESHGQQGKNEHAAHGKEVTLKGEIVDLQCLLTHPDTGKGEKHINCAKMCINKGLPVGLLSDGKIYLLLGQEHDSAKDLVVEYAGKNVELTGTLVSHAGIDAIQVKSVKQS